MSLLFWPFRLSHPDSIYIEMATGIEHQPQNWVQFKNEDHHVGIKMNRACHDG